MRTATMIRHPSAITALFTCLLLTSYTVASNSKDGFKIDVTRAGDCTHKAKKGDMIWMDYRGTLKDGGKEFDSSYGRGQPFGFHLGTGEVIQGWDQGLEGVCLGEARTLTIPAALGYGDRGAGADIPGGATLIFMTECMGINEFEWPDDSVNSGQNSPTSTSSSATQSATEATFGIATAPANPPPTSTSDEQASDIEEAVASAILSPDLPVTDIPQPSPEPGTSAPHDDDDNQTGECKLLGPFALLVQGALGALAVTSLVFKRWRETPRRPLKIWSFDVSKQVIGSVLLHILNLLMSMLSSGQFDVARAVKPGNPLVSRAEHFVQDDDAAALDKPNPCSFYLLNLAIDTTIGIPILVILLRVLHVFFSYTSLANPPESIKSGSYGQPPRATWWLKQCFIYFVGLFGMKLCVYFIFQLLPWIAWVGDWALRWTEGNEALQITFVMLVFPLIMNVFQYWIIDSFIKDPAGGDGHERLPQDEGDEEAERRSDAFDSDDSGSAELDLDESAILKGPLKEANPTPIPVYADDVDEIRVGSSGSSANVGRSA